MSVWWRVLVIGLLVACKREPARGPTLVTRVPHVDKADVVANAASPTLPPPLVVVVDETGSAFVDAGPSSWSALASYAPVKAMKPVTPGTLRTFLAEMKFKRKSPRGALATIDEYVGTPADDPPPPETDEPPPPEEEEEEPPHMDLVEKPAAKAPVPPPPPSPPKPTTTRGRYDGMNGGFKYGTAGPGPPGNPAGSGWLTVPPPPEADRMAAVTGEPVSEVLAVPAVIAVAPTAEAGALVDVVAATEGSILVESGGAVRVLRVQFIYDYDVFDYRDSRTFIEIRAKKAGLEVEAVPSPPIQLGWDFAALAKTLAPMVAMKRYSASPVDVLVHAEITAQQLVDLIVALDRAGMKSIGIGKLRPSSDDEWRLRGHWRRVFKVDRIVDDVVRDAFKLADPALRACYDAALTTQPELEGKAVITFSLDPRGKASKATVTGIDPLVGDCFIDTIHKQAFAKRAIQGPVEMTVKIQLRPYR